MTFTLDVVTAMRSQISRHPSFDASLRDGQGRSMPRSAFHGLGESPRAGRNNSFIYGLSDSRIRPLLNQEERDRLHCWSLLVALVSSAAGTTLLLAAFVR